MLDGHQSDLEKIGLSATEAQIYLTLLRHGGPLGASAVAASTRMARSSVYPALKRLTDLGLAEAEEGYGSGFSAVPPKRALPHLIVRETEELSARKHLALELATRLDRLAEPAAARNGEGEVIQVLRDPRVIAERFERLQLEAKRQMELFCKPPVFSREGNPAQDKAIRRGVRIRCLYEPAYLDVEIVRSNLEKWLSDGEEARIYDGELPHKLAIFDRQTVLMPLITPSGQGRTLFIRNPQLAASLGMLFDFIWERSAPIPVGLAAPAKQERGRRRNGRQDSTARNRTATTS